MSDLENARLLGKPSALRANASRFRSIVPSTINGNCSTTKSLAHGAMPGVTCPQRHRQRGRVRLHSISVWRRPTCICAARKKLKTDDTAIALLETYKRGLIEY